MFMGIFVILIKVRSLNKVKKYLYIYKFLLKRFNYYFVSVCCFDFNKGIMVVGGVLKVVEIN